MCGAEEQLSQRQKPPLSSLLPVTPLVFEPAPGKVPMLAVLAASSLSYTTLSSEEFHEKLYDGFNINTKTTTWS